MGAAVTALGTAVPRTVLDNAELAARVGVTEDWIFERTGIRARRVAADGETTTSLATAAARAALARADVDARELDVIVVATITPDYRFPATAPLVGAALGAPGVCAFDLGAGCSGFLYGLAQATALVESGAARRVLLVGADLLSRHLDYDDPKSSVLFGDGAGAAIVEACDGASTLGPFSLRADGSQPELLYSDPPTGLIRMQGREVYKRAVAEMTRSVRSIVATAGITMDDVDLLVAHQANARIVTAVAERLALPPEKVVTNIVRYGNTSAASIPLALAEASETGALHEGDLVLLTAFGTGFTWGAGVMRWTAPAIETEGLELPAESHV